MNRIVRALRNRFYKIKQLIMYKLQIRKLFWQTIHFNEFKNRKNEYMPQLNDDIQKQVVDNLKAKGYAEAGSIINKKLISEMAENVQLKIKDFDPLHPEKLNPNSGKVFFKQLLDNKDLEYSSPFIQYALNDDVIRVASHYLGELPNLSRIELILSHGSKSPSAPQKSQLWHRDNDDTHMVKLFTFFTDVNDLRDGPFTLLPKDVSNRLKLKTLPVHKTDNEVNVNGALDQKVQLFTPKLSTFFVDTHNCYHMGSRTEFGHYRVCLITTYNTSSRLVPYERKISKFENAPLIHRKIIYPET